MLVISAAAIGLFVEALKRTAPKLPKTYLACVALVIGLIVGIVGGFLQSDFSLVITGVFAGLAATGGYENIKALATRKPTE